MRRIVCFVVLAAAMVASLPFGGVRVSAQSSGITGAIVTQRGAITATGAVATTGLSGQNSCAVTFSGTYSGLTVVPQVSNDYAKGTNGVVNWVTASGIGSGSLSPTNNSTTTYGPGSISGQGLAGVQLNVTAFGSGTAYYTLTCSSAFVSSGGTGGTVVLSSPIPLPVTAASPVPASVWTPYAVSTGTAYGTLSTVAATPVQITITWNGSVSTNTACYVTVYNSATPTVGTNPYLGPYTITTSAAGTFALPIPTGAGVNFSTGVSVGIATTINGGTACNTAANALYISGLHF